MNGEVWLYQTYYKAKLAAEGVMNMIVSGRSNQTVYLFSKQFLMHSEHSQGYGDFVNAFRKVVWLTYRKSFIPMQPPSSFTTDTGWGCMLRSAQMLLARVIVVHRGESEWGKYLPVPSEAHCRMLRMFIDAPKYFAYYSIHRMTECGRQYGKKPGEWYGPTAVALVIRDLVESHQSIKDSSSKYTSLSSDTGQGIAVLVTDDGTLYLDEAIKLCTDPALVEQVDLQDDPMYNPKQQPWISSLFLIVPLRLGLNELNAEYISPLIEALKFPQCVGMIGGSPGHSLYFIGSRDKSLLYLDPHTVQEAATEAECEDPKFPNVEAVDTYHCKVPRFAAASSIDPSLAIGFFCKSSFELMDLVARMGQLTHFGLPFMGVMQSRPSYAAFDDDEEEYPRTKKSPSFEDDEMETASEGDDIQDFVLL